MPLRKRVRFWVAFASSALLVLSLALWYFVVWLDPGPEPLRIAPETTYLTEPLRPDGAVDYRQAIRRILGPEVPRDDNAAVPLFLAWGPKALDEEVRAPILESLGIDDLPEDGDYLVSLEEFCRAEGVHVDAEDEEHSPFHEHWIARNQACLAWIERACERRRFSVPLLEKYWIGAAMAPMQTRPFRATSDLLLARARWSLARGNPEEAVEDALRVLRLGRLQAQLPTVLYRVVACAVQGRGTKFLCKHLRTVADSKASRLRLTRALESLPPALSLLEVLRVERLFNLCVAVDSYGGAPVPGIPELRRAALERSLCINSFLSEFNGGFDRLEDALRAGTVATSIDAYSATADEMVASAEQEGDAVTSTPIWIRSLIEGPDGFRRHQGSAIAKLLMAIVASSTRDVPVMDAAVGQSLDVLRVGLSLQEYREVHGSFPSDLKALVPEILDTVPVDVMIDHPLTYTAAPDGFALYGVGRNREDDGGSEEKDVVTRVKDGSSPYDSGR